MKKILLILFSVFAALTLTAQTATIRVGNKTFREVATNYTLTNTTESWFRWVIPKDVPTTQDYQVILDSASGNHTAIAVALYGRIFDDEDWTQIGSTTTSTTGDDTVTISNSAMVRYREFKSSLTGTGTGTTTITNQALKIWLE